MYLTITLDVALQEEMVNVPNHTIDVALQEEW